MNANREFSLPDDWRDCSLFLDFDGTLVDLAASPDAVLVAPGLVQLLAAVAAQLDGRLAIVSGRPVAQLDAMLAPLKLATAGVHGAERRDASGDWHYASAPSLDAARRHLRPLVEAHNGLLLEEKRGAVALHYRLAPALEEACMLAMRAAQAACPGTVVLHGKMVLELKPAGVNKGAVVADFLREAPFQGHRPIFIGDDTTDEAAIIHAQQVGGIGIKIGAGASAAHHRVATPQALHALLVQAASNAAPILQGDPS